MTVRTTCSCGNPEREGMVHMWLACWSVHEPRCDVRLDGWRCELLAGHADVHVFDTSVPLKGADE